MLRMPDESEDTNAGRQARLFAAAAAAAAARVATICKSMQEFHRLQHRPCMIQPSSVHDPSCSRIVICKEPTLSKFYFRQNPSGVDLGEDA